MSTAIERVMRARGDLSCLHEPFMYDYYLNQGKREMPHFQPASDRAQTYEGVRDTIVTKSKVSPLFFKDMSYYVIANIKTDTRFSREITHTFLIRNPIAAIASYYRLDKAVTLDEVGYEAQWKHYRHLVSIGLKPVVITAELIAENTQAEMKHWWDRIDLPYLGHAFEWNHDYPAEWDAVKGWHGSVIESTSIKKRIKNDEKVEHRRFENALATAPHLQTYLDHHLPFYNLLKNEVI